MSSAVRPMAIQAARRIAYLQVSFFHGFVEYDLRNGARDPAGRPAADRRGRCRLRRDEYVLDSAHHGLSINPAGTSCARRAPCPTTPRSSDRSNFAYTIQHVGDKPYWSTNSGDGKQLLRVGQRRGPRRGDLLRQRPSEIASIPVGDHPQRMRLGPIRSEFLPGDRVAPAVSGARVVRNRRGRGRSLRLRLSENARLKVDVRRVRRGGQDTPGAGCFAPAVRSGTTSVRLRRLTRGALSAGGARHRSRRQQRDTHARAIPRASRGLTSTRSLTRRWPHAATRSA